MYGNWLRRPGPGAPTLLNLAPARKDGQDKDSVLLETSAGPEHRSPRVAGVSYDIYFLKRDPGQSWEEAMDALEAQDTSSEVLTAPQNWDQVVSGVKEVLDEVSVLKNPPSWEIDHEQTSIQVSCFSGEWSISVPYWSNGDAAAEIGVSPCNRRDRPDRDRTRSL